MEKVSKEKAKVLLGNPDRTKVMDTIINAFKDLQLGEGLFVSKESWPFKSTPAINLRMSGILQKNGWGLATRSQGQGWLLVKIIPRRVKL